MTFTSDPQVNHEELAEEPSSPSTPSTPSVAEVSDTSNSLTTAEAPVENSLSPELESTEGKGPYSRIKLNHPPEVIIGNMNDLTLKSVQLISVLLTLYLILATCRRLSPRRWRSPSRIRAGQKPCIMNCSSLKETMYGPWYLDQKESTS